MNRSKPKLILTLVAVAVCAALAIGGLLQCVIAAPTFPLRPYSRRDVTTRRRRDPRLG